MSKLNLNFDFKTSLWIIHLHIAYPSTSYVLTYLPKYLYYLIKIKYVQIISLIIVVRETTDRVYWNVAAAAAAAFILFSWNVCRTLSKPIRRTRNVGIEELNNHFSRRFLNSSRCIWLNSNTTFPKNVYVLYIVEVL